MNTSDQSHLGSQVVNAGGSGPNGSAVVVILVAGLGRTAGACASARRASRLPLKRMTLPHISSPFADDECQSFD